MKWLKFRAQFDSDYNRSTNTSYLPSTLWHYQRINLTQLLIQLASSVKVIESFRNQHLKIQHEWQLWTLNVCGLSNYPQQNPQNERFFHHSLNYNYACRVSVCHYRVSHDLSVSSHNFLGSSHDLFIVSHRFLIRSHNWMVSSYWKSIQRHQKFLGIDKKIVRTHQKNIGTNQKFMGTNQ